MASATIQYPNGPRVRVGKKIDLLVKYVGADPAPDDIHLLTHDGDGNWSEQFGGDVPAGVDPRAGSVESRGLVTELHEHLSKHPEFPFQVRAGVTP